MLTRDTEGTKWWHSLTEEQRAETDLFATGYGRTITEAVMDVNAKVAPRAAA